MKAIYKKIIDNRASFWISVLVVGPLALPLLWRDARYSKTSKIVITVLVGIFTLFLVWVSVETAKYTNAKVSEALEQIRKNNEDY